MLLSGLAKTLSLWIAVAVLGRYAYHSASLASALDLRRPDGALWIAVACLLGLLSAKSLARWRPTRFAPLDADRLGLALLMAAVALQAFANVEGYTSVRVLREQIPPEFAPLYPLWAALIPLWLTFTGQRLSAADQALRLFLVVFSAGSALFLLPGAAILTLALPVVFLQWHDGPPRLRGSAWLPVLSVGLLLLATLWAYTPILASPTLPWVLAGLCLTLAVAARPRPRSELVALIAAAIAAPLLVTAADVVMSVELAQQVSWKAALDTRPTLFRQHPNFLAPLFAVGSLLAASLAWCSARGRLLAVFCAALLAAATWHTDSNAGKGALLIGLLLLPGLRLALPVARRLPMTRLVLALVLLVAVLGAGLWAFGDHASLAPLTAGLDRFEKSLDYRLDAWRNSLRVIEANPLLGIGPGTFITLERFSPESRFFSEVTSPHPHNVFLYIAQAGGIPCLLVVLAWLIGLAFALGRAASEDRDDGLGRPLALGLLATLLALLGANLLDLGLALETVIPGPVFLITGLVLAQQASQPAEPLRLRFLGALLVCVTALLPWWHFGVRPLRAQTLFDRAQHRGYLATRASDGEALKLAARRDLSSAIELDPDNFDAHDLLARWHEQQPDGHSRAHAVLKQLVARAPFYGPAHSLLAAFYLRLGDDVQAAETLRHAIQDRHGWEHRRRDRARLVEALARMGQRDQAFDLLVESLQLDAAIIHDIHWRGTPGSDELSLLVERGAQTPILLVNAVGTLYSRQKEAQLSGQTIGRRYWMDTPNAFRLAGRDDLALDVYAWLEAHIDSIDFVRHNLHVLAVERGAIALEAGDLPEALAQFERAVSISNNPFFVTQVEHVRRLMSGQSLDEGAVATPTDEAEAAAAFANTGEILDQPTALRDNLNSRASIRQAENDPAGAAALLEKSLLYHDELMSRAELWERIGTLYLAGDEPHAAERALLATLHEFDAKPLPVSSLIVGLADTLAARVARKLCAAWRAQGLRPEQLLEAAWSRIPHFTRARPAMALVRMEIAREAGRADQLDREADLALLDDRTSMPALWARLEASEALGQHHRLHALMAPLAEQFAGGRDPEERVAQLVKALRPREEDPATWREIGIARLLQGRYREAAGLFASAQERVPENDTRQLSELIAWEARALLLSNQVDSARRRLHEAVRLAPERGLLALRLATLGPAGGQAEAPR
ncbi:MAG: hypothetical protein DHS20C15_00100 [Planctomycetota bacterium]|nr:MAG: hypothetical protein DHS20C15_00100 [Planctomycetota bacterium]